MAVKRRVNWVSQQRVDVPDLRSIESAASNDFDELLQTLYLGSGEGYIFRGFDISMAGLIGGAASGALMNVDQAAILHSKSKQSGTFLVVRPGTAPQVLNSAINPIVQGSFSPSSLNFVGIEYVRFIDDTTATQVYIWDPTINDETTKIIPRAQILQYNIVISTGTWASNVLPVCTITTDAGNNVISIEDNRRLMMRLGTAGRTTPNPFYSYPWTAQSEGRTESPFISSSNAINPFHGGDKMLGTEKDWKDAIMSVIKEIKGSAFWYTAGSSSVGGVNLTDLFFDSSASLLAMRGKFIHSKVTPGMLTWTGDLYIDSIIGNLRYKIPAGNVTLNDHQVAYVVLNRADNFQPSNTFTFTYGSNIVTGSSLVAGIFPGDYIVFFSDSMANIDQVTNVSGNTITLANPYGVSAPTPPPGSPNLGTAANYGILAASAITNSVGTSTVNGSMGEYPGSTVTGAFTVTGSTDLGNAAAHSAQNGALAAYTDLSTRPSTIIPSALDGQTLTAGVYSFSSGAATLAQSGPATLTFHGSATDIFVIQCASSLTTGAGGVATISLTGGALASNVYWAIGSSATINVGSPGTFVGTIIAQASITNTSGGTVNGRLIALTAAITLSQPATINVPSSVPIGASVSGIALSYTGSYTMQVSNPDSVPANGNVYWIAKRDDNGSITASIAAPATGAVRVSGITTFTTTGPHGINAGQGVQVAGVTDTTFNGFYEVITTPTANTFTVVNTGLDATSGNGTVNGTATIYLRGIGEISQGEVISDDSSQMEAVLEYIGAAYAGDTQPQYGSTNIVTQGIDLTSAISELDVAAGTSIKVSNQDRNLKLIKGGTWFFSDPVLSWSADAFIQIPGQADNLNRIAAGSVTLASDDQVAYVEINRSGAPATLTVNVAAIASVALDSNTVIIARRNGSQIIVGTHSFALLDGEASLNDGALGVLDQYFSELRLSAVRPTNNQTILISNSDVTMLTGETRSQRISSFLLNFPGATVNFQTGVISGVSGVNFTPVIPAAGMWRWFTIVVIPNVLGSDNRMSGDILVLPAAADGASAAAAPRSIFAGTGIALGQIVVTSSDGTNISPIPQANIVQLGVGSGSGSGSGSLIKVNLYDGVDTALPSSTPVVIDGVTVANNDLVVFTQLLSGNNRVYEAAVTPGSTSPTLPNQIVFQMSTANPYAGGNMEVVTGGIATAQPANDMWFTIDGTITTGSGNPAIAGSFSGSGLVFSDMTSGVDWIDQPFVASVSGPLGSVTIRTYWDATVGSGNLDLSIWTDNAGVPGTRISSIAPINTADLGATASGSQTPSAITTYFAYGSLVSGQTYHLVIDPTNVSFASTLRLLVSTSGATNPFLLTSTNSGGTWSVNSSVNANFNVTTSSGLMAENVFGVSSTDNISITSTSNVAAQPFSPNITQTTAAVMYTMSRASGVLGGTFSVGIYNDSAGSPGSLINSVNVNASTLTNAGVGINYIITQLTTTTLVAGNQYWILWNFANVTGLGGSGIIFLGTGACAATQPPELSLSSDGGSTFPIIGSTTAIYTVLAGSRGSGDTSVGQYNNGTQFNALTGTNFATSQPFVASANGDVVSASVDLWIGNGSTYNGYITLGIYADNGSGQPGTLLSNLSSIAHNLIPTSPGNFNPYNFVGATLVSGTTYHLVTSLAHLTLVSGSYEIRIASDTPSLTSPGAIESTDTGATFPTPLLDSGSPVNQHYFVAVNANRIATNSVALPGPSQQMNFQTLTATSNWRAQPFTAPSNITMGSVKLPLGTGAAPGALQGNLRVSIYSNSGGVPGVRLSQYSFIDASTLTAEFQNYSVPQTLGLTSGTVYFIVLDPTNVTGISVGNSIHWGAWIITPTSVPPSSVQTLNSGSTWSSGGGGVTDIFDVFPPFSGGGSTPTIIAQNLSINSTENETTNTTSLGQTFTAASTAFLTDAKFQLSILTASPPNSGNLVAKVYTDSAGQPGTLLETSSPVNSAILTTTPTTYTFNFAGTTSLTSGTLYHVIVDDSALAGTVIPGSISWTPQPEFASPYDPAIGDLLVITQGIEFANQISEFNGSTWLVNNTVRYFNGVDFWEQSSIITSTLLNNTSGNVFSVTALGSENIIIDFSILRSGNKETGTIWLTNNGIVAEASAGGAYTAATGVTFSGSMSGGNVSLSYVTDNSGGDVTFKYSIKRWSDGGAGPTGLPSYSPVLPGGVLASAFTMSDGSSTPYNCLSPFNVLGLTNVTLLFAYTVGSNGGSTVGNLDVFVNGQRISRFVSSAVTPPSGGTYYTEVSSTQIQFTADITTSPLTVEIIKRA
jgi:hypothetical protein